MNRELEAVILAHSGGYITARTCSLFGNEGHPTFRIIPATGVSSVTTVVLFSISMRAGHIIQDGSLTRFSPRTTLSSCHPTRPWPSSFHDRTAELLASPGWALTAASCNLMSLCPSAVGFSEPPSALRAPQWNRVVALERSRARCSLHPACGRAWTLRITLHRQLV